MLPVVTPAGTSGVSRYHLEDVVDNCLVISGASLHNKPRMLTAGKLGFCSCFTP